MVIVTQTVMPRRNNQSKLHYTDGWQVTSCAAEGKIQSSVHMGLYKLYLVMCSFNKPDLT